MDQRRIQLLLGNCCLAGRYNFYTASVYGKRTIVTSMSVCLSVQCGRLHSQSYLKNHAAKISRIFVRAVCGRVSVLLRRRRNAVWTSGFADDVVSFSFSEPYGAGKKSRLVDRHYESMAVEG